METDESAGSRVVTGLKILFLENRMKVIEETFPPSGALTRSQRDDLQWLDDHPDFWERVRPLRADDCDINPELLVSVEGVAVSKSTEGLSKILFDNRHYYYVRLERELRQGHLRPYDEFAEVVPPEASAYPPEKRS